MTPSKPPGVRVRGRAVTFWRAVVCATLRSSAGQCPRFRHIFSSLFPASCEEEAWAFGRSWTAAYNYDLGRPEVAWIFVEPVHAGRKEVWP